VAALGDAESPLTMNLKYAVLVGEAFSSREGAPPFEVFPSDPVALTKESASAENVKVCCVADAAVRSDATARPPATNAPSATASPAYLSISRMRIPLQTAGIEAAGLLRPPRARTADRAVDCDGAVFAAGRRD
jgi:hypothetical protein